MVEDAISGTEITAAPCLPALASLPLRWGEGSVYSWLALLWYLPNPLFCEWARLCVRLEPFSGKFSPFFFLSLFLCGSPTVWVAISHYSLRLSSGHSGPALTLSTDDATRVSLPSPACWWQTQVSGLLLHWQFWLSAYSVGLLLLLLFFSQLCYPLRSQNSPQTQL